MTFISRSSPEYGKVLIQKINASIWFQHKEEEEELTGR